MVGASDHLPPRTDRRSEHRALVASEGAHPMNFLRRIFCAIFEHDTEVEYRFFVGAETGKMFYICRRCGKIDWRKCTRAEMAMITYTDLYKRSRYVEVNNPSLML